MRSTTSKPSLEDEIRARAHEIWLHEGQPHGRDQAHWQQAEAEIAAVQRKPARKPPANKSAAAPKTPPRRSAAPASSTRRKKAAD
ncbi:MAG TPA: DUF2934 domain-containing protein [Stellaceae bacterium]|nr:DUF2934 domain-containing protein [Stellaceae bacterium]